jgi:beta-glucanase (GH16 family)
VALAAAFGLGLTTGIYLPARDERPIWSDEFDTLDRTKWNLRGPERRDVDIGCNIPDNASVEDGHLVLRVKREQVQCGSEKREFTESYLDTIGRHSWTYGSFEVRAKAPGTTGVWPAFWLRPDDGGHGEIDVMELPGKARYTAAIFHDYTPVKEEFRLTMADGWHVYRTDWDKDSLNWYVDGTLVWTRNRLTTPWFDEVFHKPYNLRLNVQVGGWLGDPDASVPFPADFLVDYVRVYQH